MSTERKTVDSNEYNSDRYQQLQKSDRGSKRYQGNNFQTEKFCRSDRAFNNKKNLNVAPAYWLIPTQ